MALNIKDPLTEKYVRELAAATGEGITTAIRKATQERLQRVRKDSPGRLATQLLDIGLRCSTLPDLDSRTAEEILDFDENGLPR